MDGSSISRRRLARWRAVAALAVAAVALSGCDWTFFHGDAAGTGVAPDPGPDVSQVATLHTVWGFHPGYSIYATPVTRNGTMFLAGGNGTLYALDVRTIRSGAPVVKWSKAYGLKTEHYCGSPQGFVSSPTVTDDASGNPRVLLYTPQGTLQELDGRNGSVVWQSTVYTIPNDNQDDYYSWSTPLVANGLVYVGVSSDCDKPFVPSALFAFTSRPGRSSRRITRCRRRPTRTPPPVPTPPTRRGWDRRRRPPCTPARGSGRHPSPTGPTCT